jgi:hypothetical protein
MLTPIWLQRNILMGFTHPMWLIVHAEVGSEMDGGRAIAVTDMADVIKLFLRPS